MQKKNCVIANLLNGKAMHCNPSVISIYFNQLHLCEERHIKLSATAFSDSKKIEVFSS